MKVNTYIWIENQQTASQLKKNKQWGEFVNQRLKAFRELENGLKPVKQPLTKKAK